MPPHTLEPGLGQTLANGSERYHSSPVAVRIPPPCAATVYLASGKLRRALEGDPLVVHPNLPAGGPRRRPPSTFSLFRFADFRASLPTTPMRRLLLLPALLLPALLLLAAGARAELL